MHDKNIWQKYNLKCFCKLCCCLGGGGGERTLFRTAGYRTLGQIFISVTPGDFRSLILQIDNLTGLMESVKFKFDKSILTKYFVHLQNADRFNIFIKLLMKLEIVHVVSVKKIEKAQK